MGRRDLSKEERETIFLTSEGDDTYDIYTFNGDLRRKLKRYAAKHPELCSVILDEPELGCTTFSIRKTQVSFRLLKPFSESERKEAIERGKRTGYQKKTKTDKQEERNK